MVRTLESQLLTRARDNGAILMRPYAGELGITLSLQWEGVLTPDVIQAMLMLAGADKSSELKAWLVIHTRDGVLGFPRSGYPSERANYELQFNELDYAKENWYWQICTVLLAEPVMSSVTPGDLVEPYTQKHSLVERIVQLVKSADTDRFIQQCGNEGPYEGCEGSCRAIERVVARGGERFHFELCHVEYPK